MQNFIDFLATMPFWYWWVLALVLLVIELGTGSTYFLWPAAAAVFVGLFSLGPIAGAWQMQLILFAAVTIVLAIFAPPYVKPWLRRTQADHPNLNERGAQKIGRRAIVAGAFVNGAGKVRLADTLWIAEAVDGQDFADGASVEIVRTEGARLFVKAVQ